MARVDWFSFLRQHNISYTTVGPNASRGRVNIACPFCDDDPSEHLGIHLNGGGWNCWRNPHRGIFHTPQTLVAKLLHCSLAEAAQYVGDVPLPSDEDIGSELRSRLGEAVTPTLVHLALPKEFKPLNNGSRFADQFLAYLRGRGYKHTQLQWLIEAYRLHYALTGRFAYRIIIPICDRYGKLLTWTGRSILPNEELRYRSLSKEQQACSPKETLLGLPLLWGCPNPKVLVVVEGPFDAFWITAFGRSFGVYGTCLFGLTMSASQSALLLELRARFPRQVLLLDSAASFQAFRMANSGVTFETQKLPLDIKDPATLTVEEVIEFCMKI